MFQKQEPILSIPSGSEILLQQRIAEVTSARPHSIRATFSSSGLVLGNPR